jgi:hypothetical protein
MGHARESDSVREEIMILIKDTLSRPPLSGGFCPANTPRITTKRHASGTNRSGDPNMRAYSSSHIFERLDEMDTGRGRQPLLLRREDQVTDFAS